MLMDKMSLKEPAFGKISYEGYNSDQKIGLGWVKIGSGKSSALHNFI